MIIVTSKCRIVYFHCNPYTVMTNDLPTTARVQYCLIPLNLWSIFLILKLHYKCVFLLQGLQKRNTAKINEFTLLGVNYSEKNVFNSYIIGFVDSSFDVNDNCPHNLNTCGIAGKAKQIESVQDSLKNVFLFQCLIICCLRLSLLSFI